MHPFFDWLSSAGFVFPVGYRPRTEACHYIDMAVAYSRGRFANLYCG